VDRSWVGQRVASRSHHASWVTCEVSDLRAIPPEVSDEEATFATLAGVTMNGLRRAGLVGDGRGGLQSEHCAGDGGELVYRELLNNPGLQYVPVAFADDDAAKAGRFIHGIPVYSTTASFADVRRKLQLEEVLISTAKIADDRLRAIVGECAAAGLIVRRACMSFEPLVPGDFGWVVSEIPSGMPLVSRQGDVNLIHDHHLHVSTDH